MCIRDSYAYAVPAGESRTIRLRLTDAHPPERSRLDFIPVCLLYTSDAADERSSVDLGGRRIIKKKKENSDATNG